MYIDFITNIFQILEPPRIIAHPQNTTVKPGGHALFSCVASGNPLPRITWYKDGRPLAASGRVYFGDTNTRYNIIKFNVFIFLRW